MPRALSAARIARWFLASFLTACAPASPPRVVAHAASFAAQASAPAAPIGASACALVTQPLAPAALAADIAALADPALDGRAPGTAGDVAARALIERRFSCVGLTPAGADGAFAQPFHSDAAATANVIAVLPGTDEALAQEIVLVMAHHDHLGAGHLGANDNASGVAAMLAIAQHLAAGGARKRTIAFVAFGAEEQGLVGSAHYLANPPSTLPLASTKHVVNLDMIGSYSSKRRVYVFGAHRGAPGSARLAQLARRYPKTRFSIGGHSVRGDHLGFSERGIPYAFFWTPDGRCYHRRCDTADRVDAVHLSDIASLAADFIADRADE